MLSGGIFLFPVQSYAITPEQGGSACTPGVNCKTNTSASVSTYTNTYCTDASKCAGTGSASNPFEYAHGASTAQGALAGQLTGMALKIGVNFGVMAAVHAMTAARAAIGLTGQLAQFGGFPVHDKAVLAALTTPTAHDAFDDLHRGLLAGLAKIIAEQIVHQIAVSIVNWINGGFNGNPAFVTDLEGLMQNTANQITVGFLNEITREGGPYAPLIAGAIQSEQNGKFNSAPIFTGALATSQNLDHYLGGDWDAGNGWDGWYQLTQNEQNNYIGAYLASKTELSRRIAQAQGTLQKKLDWGQGFQSKEVCDGTYIAKGDNVNLTTGTAANDESNATASVGQSSCDHKSIATPGSVIRESLNRSLDSDLITLENVHDINEIVNALMGQLINYVTTSVDGLAGASTRKPSQTKTGVQTSFTADLGVTDTTTLVALQKPLLDSIDTSIAKAIDPQKAILYTDALTKVDTTEALFNAIIACYQTKLSPPPAVPPDIEPAPLSDNDITTANVRIETAQTTISDEIESAKAALQYELSIINSKPSDLQALRAELVAAQDISTVQDISDRFNALDPYQSTNTTTEADIAALQKHMSDLSQDANQKINECNAFPPQIQTAQ